MSGPQPSSVLAPDSSPSAAALAKIATFFDTDALSDAVTKEALMAQCRELMKLPAVESVVIPVLSSGGQQDVPLQPPQVQVSPRRDATVSVSEEEVDRRAPSNRTVPPLAANGQRAAANVSTAEEQEREMKRYRPFALAAFGLVLSVAIFCLSNNVNLSEAIKVVVSALLLGMCFVSVMTVAAAFAGHLIVNKVPDLESSGSSSWLEMDGAITVVNMGILVMVVYVINIILLILYSFTHQSKKVFHNLLYIGTALDLVTVLAWINIWKRPQFLYSWKLMAALRDFSWALGSWFFGLCGLCDAFKKMQTAAASNATNQNSRATSGETQA